jgi:hypothetical protein
MPVRSMYVIMYITLISRRTSQRVFVGLGIAVRWNAGGFGIGIPVQDHTTLAVDHSQEIIPRRRSIVLYCLYKSLRFSHTS